MTRSLVALWGTLLAAIITISVLAQFWISQRQRSAQQRVEEILLTRLVPHNDVIQRLVDIYSVEMQRSTYACDLNSPQSCVALMRSPLIGTLVVVDAESRLVYPADISSASQDRQSLIDEAQQLLSEMADPRPSARLSSSPPVDTAFEQQANYDDLPIFNSRSYSNRQQSNAQGEPEFSSLTTQSIQEATEDRQLQSESSLPTSPSRDPSDSNLNDKASDKLSSPVSKEFGWITWYHRRGMVLGFWWNQGDQRRAIATLPRARWMADIVAALPDSRDLQPLLRQSNSQKLNQEGFNQLIDVEGNVIYQWGTLPDQDWKLAVGQLPDAVQTVVPPFEGWRLRIYAPPSLKQLLAGDNIVPFLWMAVGGLSLALLLGGLLVTTSFNRQMRLAARRVSFVNQVSHELRTPLTNICMYADLLASSMAIDELEDDVNVQRVAVIQNESQRLSRLIGNVLQFARSESKPAELHQREAVIDDVVRDVLGVFEPRLREVGITLSMNLNLSQKRRIDPDVVEQILINLVGNAEKYAAGGKRLEITSRSLGEQVEITVRDFGPGVPARMAEKIFQPFVRLSDRLEDPAGTGIGLTIARDLARRHGGDCVLSSDRPGAAFGCTLRAPLVSGPSAS